MTGDIGGQNVLLTDPPFKVYSDENIDAEVQGGKKWVFDTNSIFC